MRQLAAHLSHPAPTASPLSESLLECLGMRPVFLKILGTLDAHNSAEIYSLVANQCIYPRGYNKAYLTSLRSNGGIIHKLWAESLRYMQISIDLE